MFIIKGYNENASKIMYNIQLQGRQDLLLHFSFAPREEKHSLSLINLRTQIGSHLVVTVLKRLYLGMTFFHPCIAITKAQPSDVFIQCCSREHSAFGFVRTQASFHYHGLRCVSFSQKIKLPPVWSLCIFGLICFS